MGLSESAFARASSLDVSRKLQAAEAPPWLVERARAAERKSAAAALTQARVEVTPAGAHLRLDGRELGAAPLELLVPSGSHVLQVDAPGYVTYASLLELGPGRRLPIQIQLAPTPLEQARQRLAPLAPVASPKAPDAAPQAVPRASPRAFGATDQAPAEKRTWWKKWPFWTATMAAVGAGIAAAVVATRPDAAHETRELRLDPGRLPP
jgi:hypothetical protein